MALSIHVWKVFAFKVRSNTDTSDVESTHSNTPASAAQLDGCLTGDQEVTGSIPTRSGNILSWRLIMKYFVWSSLSSTDSRRAVLLIQEGQLSVSGKSMCTSTI